MIPKSACPLWLADIRSDPCRKARPSAVSYTTPVDTIRRRMAMGCERMQTPQGDKCGAHFPCLGNGLADGN
ncbi:hypothetical protein ELH66_34780 [Rhizobium ruizarguesonis]|nr:hypothetical protein ELH66_34780 [Rhizobium ruizarguesonis]